MASIDGWDGILDEGEEILWQGRPDPRVVFRGRHLLTVTFGAFFAGFALVWMLLASSGGGYFWTFGLIHFTVGLGIMAGPIFWPAWARRHTWYTLTDRRAFIATDIPFQGRKLRSFPIAAKTRIDYQQGPPDTIHFAEEYRRTKNGSHRVAIGFERIDKGDEVYRLIRDIQRAEA
ncbi:hypothetical protein AIOL_003154 [Candidatus Rhodobacter oscarellae]|uniref:Aspartate carbamoyltransferase catalytic subunit n=1 Tax=Candidatus Rhodobacter oscarellae TaxID=1675527 RepID=A0A0J9GXH0_9RHOB|nr:hypothetical protein [Candidatus Rhodobacter lobularis]KMW58183.1 hypothetical protein AIOL_003154 [Candidatus Rhodobacter lobularis]